MNQTIVRRLLIVNGQTIVGAEAAEAFAPMITPEVVLGAMDDPDDGIDN